MGVSSCQWCLKKARWKYEVENKGKRGNMIGTGMYWFACPNHLPQLVSFAASRGSRRIEEVPNNQKKEGLMAAANINKVIITGNLTKDPELRETGKGTPVCELRVACNTSIKKDGNWESRPNYFQVNVWGGMAENCDKFLAKGSKVGIDGRLEWQKWETDEGKTNSRVVIVANQIEFLSSSKNGAKADAKGEDDELPF